jgi:general secretion pathway protein G
VTKPLTEPLPEHWKDGGYLDALPSDPWGHPYVYLSPGVHRDYDIVSYGSDGLPGGEGNDADIESWNLPR